MLVLRKGQRERREALLEFPVSHGDLFSSFCAHSSVHGTVRLICSRGNGLKTGLWGGLIALSLSLLCWQLCLIGAQYSHRPLLYSISVNTHPLPFPALTLCSLNPPRPVSVAEELRVLDQIAAENLRSLCGHTDPPSPPSPRFPFLHSLPLVRNSSWMVGFKLCNETGGDCFFRWHSSGVEALREWYTFHLVNLLGREGAGVESAGRGDREAREFISDCTYNGVACAESNYSSFQHPLYGECFTFNGKNGSQQWVSLSPGKGNGLSLLLRPAADAYLPYFSPSVGARLVIHPQNTLPFMEDGGFELRTGIETSLSLRKEDVSRLGGSYGDCTHDGKEVGVINLYPGAYTQQACLRSCFQMTMVTKCGCAHYLYPLPDGAEYCDYRRHTAWGHCYYRLYKEYTDNVLGCFKICRKPCRQTEYSVVAGYGKWPSGNSKDWMYRILDQENGKIKSNRKTVAKLNIYYRELNYKTTSETPAFPAEVMLSALGGQLGLFFGCSVLSLAEILELLVDLTTVTLLVVLGRCLGTRAQDPA